MKGLGQLLGLGTPRLFLDPVQLSNQLKTEMPWQEAAPIVGIATGLDGVLIANPMIAGMTSDQVAMGLAAQYGQMLLTLEGVIADPDLAEEYRTYAIALRERIAQVTRLAQIDIQPIAATPPSNQNTANIQAETFDAVLTELGL